MLRRSVDSLNNSIGSNILQDDETAMNYKALAWCIVGMEKDGKLKHPSIGQACSAYRLYNPTEAIKTTGEITVTKSTRSTRRKIECVFEKPKLVINIRIGETKEYQNSNEVEEAIGIKRKAIATYIRNKAAFKREYLIVLKESGDPENILKDYKQFLKSKGVSKNVKLSNVKTGEVKIFNSAVETAKFLGVINGYISLCKKEKKLIKKIWKVEYLD